MKAWEDKVRKVTPYVPGEQPQEKDMIKLNTNENPYPPSPKVYEAHKKLDVDRFALYPDPAASELVKGLEKYYHLREGRVFVGVGSDDVLALAFLTFFNSKKSVLFPDITYSFYPVWADVYRIPYETPALDENFKIRIQDYMKENGGIVIANPNAPTSIGMAVDEIEAIIKANPDVVVIIDEAYVDFGGQTVLPLIDRYDNLLVVRTYSKSRSMAGMRIGFAMGNEALIQAMTDVKESINSYTMTQESICVGAASLADEDYFRDKCGKVMATRTWTKEELEKRGFYVLPSQTNFLFARHKAISGKVIFEQLRKENIYVRHFDAPRIKEFNRITIGTDEQMKKFMKILDKILEKNC